MIKKIVFSWTFFAVFAPAIFAGEEGVVLFQDRYFRGTSETFFEEDPNLRDNLIGNDRVRSVKVPAGCIVTLYEDKDFEGRAVVLRGNQANLADTELGNDSVSSLRIDWARPGNRGNKEQGPGVTLYSRKNFRGKEETLYRDDFNLRDNAVGNDRLSSIRVPAGYSVILYSDADYRGKAEILNGDDSDLSDNAVGSDRVSSIRIQYRPGHGPGRPDERDEGVVLFADAYYRGRSATVYEDQNNLRHGDFRNDRLRSIKIPDGFVVTLYEHADFGGESERLARDDADLGDNRIGTDRVSSLRIERLPSGVVTRGRPVEQGPKRGNRDPGHGPRGPAVELFEHESYKGKREWIYTDDPDLGDNDIGNDTLSSIRVPQGMTVIIYEHVNYGGNSVTLNHDLHDMGHSRIGNDRASSIRIKSNNKPSGEPAFLDRLRGVTLFEHANFQGGHQTLSEDVANLKGSELGNDKLSSIRVPKGWKLTLFSDSKFRGRSEEFFADDADLSNNAIGDNQVSSIKIEWVGNR